MNEFPRMLVCLRSFFSMYHTWVDKHLGDSYEACWEAQKGPPRRGEIGDADYGSLLGYSSSERVSGVSRRRFPIKSLQTTRYRFLLSISPEKIFKKTKIHFCPFLVFYYLFLMKSNNSFCLSSSYHEKWLPSHPPYRKWHLSVKSIIVARV